MVGHDRNDCSRVVRTDFGAGTGEMVYETEDGRVWCHDPTFHQPGCVKSAGLRGYLHGLNKFETTICRRKPRNVI